ncbi:MAG TPA: HAD family hydrolase [Actinomycetota bacterium]|nr:HAD family hydrolase [Actinomycetota bacterium]
MIRAVTFDCWGTLLTDRDYTCVSSTRVRALAEHSGGKLTVADARELLDRAWRTHYDSWVSGCHYGSEGMADFCVRELGGPEELSATLCAAFEDAAQEGDVEALPGAVESLKLLREAGIRTALVCDTGFTPGRVVRRFMEQLGLAGHLEFYAFSNEVGVPKPDRRMFLAALDGLAVSPAEAVHVGDLLRTDVTGARGAGMKTVRITALRGSGSPIFAKSESDDAGDEADEVVSTHWELPDALRRLGVAV